MKNSLHSKQKIIHYLLAVITVGFAGLTVFVWLDPLSVIDQKFSAEIQEHNSPVMDLLMDAVSWFGYMPNSFFIVIGVAAIFLLCGLRREAVFILLTLSAGLISTLLKLAVNRPRPLPSMVRVIEETRQQSFPSGHVLFYVVFFGFLILLMLRSRQIPTLARKLVITGSGLLILAIPISRIYLGAHWFSDVLGGFLAGLLWLYLLSKAYLRV